MSTGKISLKIRRQVMRSNESLFHALFEADGIGKNMDCRLSAMSDILSLYGGNVDVALWVLSHIDRNSNKEDTISLGNSNCFHGTLNDENDSNGYTSFWKIKKTRRRARSSSTPYEQK